MKWEMLFINIIIINIVIIIYLEKLLQKSVRQTRKL